VAGGFTQVRKIAALAQAPFARVFPHLMGSPVSIAAFVQLGAEIPDCLLREGAHTATPQLTEIVDQPLTLEEGRIIVAGRPGIGIEVRQDRLTDFSHKPDPITGSFHADRSVAH
jgi:L-alanine-DL-glutamate epimerase-like enolase superfamily enzyme